jgi:type II secretory pathway component PulM
LHWLDALKWLGAAVAALGAWRWLVRPTRIAWRRLIELLTAIRNSSTGVQSIARDLDALAGAAVQLFVPLLDDVRVLRAENEELRARQTDQGDLLLEVMGDIRDLRNRPTED